MRALAAGFSLTAQAGGAEVSATTRAAPATTTARAPAMQRTARLRRKRERGGRARAGGQFVFRNAPNGLMARACIRRTRSSRSRPGRRARTRACASAALASPRRPPPSAAPGSGACASPRLRAGHQGSLLLSSSGSDNAGEGRRAVSSIRMQTRVRRPPA